MLPTEPAKRAAEADLPRVPIEANGHCRPHPEAEPKPLDSDTCPECGAIASGNFFCGNCRRTMNERHGWNLPPFDGEAEMPCGKLDLLPMICKLKGVQPLVIFPPVANDGTYFIAAHGDRYAELGFDELIALVSAMFMPESRPCLHWLRTDRERLAERKAISDRQAVAEVPVGN
jgi:hypothetical protein